MSQRKHVMSTTNPDEPGIAYLPICRAGFDALEALGLTRVDNDAWGFGYHDDKVFKWQLPEGWTVREDFNHIGYVLDERGVKRLRFWHDWKSYSRLSPLCEVIDVADAMYGLLLDPTTLLANTQFALLTSEEVERVVELLEARAAGQLERRLWETTIDEPAAASLRLAEILPILNAAAPDGQT